MLGPWVVAKNLTLITSCSSRHKGEYCLLEKVFFPPFFLLAYMQAARMGLPANMY